ncbi:hypothetical protein EIP86_008628 [Pleurotus ostreatoroseus]|nr:hypothetical protein EIP86_008628 [Pleurotus ostreatoroseus]
MAQYHLPPVALPEMFESPLENSSSDSSFIVEPSQPWTGPFCIAPCAVFDDFETVSRSIFPADLHGQNKHGTPYVPFVSAFGGDYDSTAYAPVEPPTPPTAAATYDNVSGLMPPPMNTSTLTPAMSALCLPSDVDALSPLPLPLPLPSESSLPLPYLMYSPAQTPDLLPSFLPEIQASSASEYGLKMIKAFRSHLALDMSSAIVDDEGEPAHPIGTEQLDHTVAEARKPGRSKSFPSSNKPSLSPARKKYRSQSSSVPRSPRSSARNSRPDSLVGPARTPTMRSRSIAPGRVKRSFRNEQYTDLSIDSEGVIVFPEPIGNACPKARSGCPYVQTSPKPSEMKRHIESHYTEELRRLGYAPRCCGIPLSKAREDGLCLDGLEVTIYTRREGSSEDETIEMVGGCDKSFGRKDAYLRHLKQQSCLGDGHGWWVNSIVVLK